MSSEQVTNPFLEIRTFLDFPNEFSSKEYSIESMVLFTINFCLDSLKCSRKRLKKIEMYRNYFCMRKDPDVYNIVLWLPCVKRLYYKETLLWGDYD